MAIPSNPPQPKFKWPKKWQIWVKEFLGWNESTQPVPDPNDFAVSEKPHGRYFSLLPQPASLGKTNRTPLEIFTTNSGADIAIEFVYGTVDGTVADSAMSGGGNKKINVTATGSAWVQFPCEYDGDTGSWSRTGAPSAHADATVPAATPTLAVLKLGDYTIVAGNVTILGAVKPGSVGWERCGPDDNFHDKFPTGS